VQLQRCVHTRHAFDGIVLAVFLHHYGLTQSDGSAALPEQACFGIPVGLFGRAASAAGNGGFVRWPLIRVESSVHKEGVRWNLADHAFGEHGKSTTLAECIDTEVSVHQAIQFEFMFNRTV
jgi:hypothetical protein